MDDYKPATAAPGAPIRADFIPASDYTGREIMDLEREKLWPRTWQIACRVEEVPQVADYVNYKLLEESILIVRISKDEIKAFYNVCQHRGRRLIDNDKGNLGTAGFYCRFHGWRYKLDGAVSYVHWRENWKDCNTFKDSDLGLKEPRIGFWGGWVWINMDPNAVPLEEYLHPIPDVMKNFGFENLRYTWYETIIAPVNWKVVVEAFNEGYHSGATHSQIVGYTQMQWPAHAHGIHSMYYTTFDEMPKIYKDGAWKKPDSLIEMLYFQYKDLHDNVRAQCMEPGLRAVTRLRDETPPDTPPGEVMARFFELHKEEVKKTGAVWPEKLTLEELNNAGTSWHVFPNTMFLPFSIDGILWYRFRPYGDDPDRCIFDIWCLSMYPPGREPKVEQHISNGFDEFRGRAPFLEQDFDNMEGTNMGMKSRGWVGARTNCVQEVAVTNFHRNLRRYLYE